MGLEKCGLNLNHNHKELQAHGTAGFPCAAYLGQYTDKPEQVIPWHWHEELEIAYVKNGTIKLKIPTKTYFLEKGDCIMINSNILHYAIAAPQCELESLVFHPTLITGNNISAFAEKYLSPLIEKTSFDGYLFKRDYAEKEINHFISAFHAAASDVSGFEFIIRENLSQICFYLYQQFEQEIITGEAGLNQDNFRIRKMLDYIHSHFSEAVMVSEIAKAADIGERECMRCFQRTIHISPIQYLLKYRIMQGADILLKSPSESISEVSAFCGFDSPSNFSKIFKRFYHCTPREYKNSHKKQGGL
ncbi:AraC family transcriptional regulator [Lachnospiraceae bacterium 62-35]